MEDVTVERDDAARRYVIRVGGRPAGRIDFVERGDVTVMTHAEIEPSEQGQGIGSLLVAGALDDVRALGRHVDPRCPFVAAYLSAHHEYDDLLRGD